MQADNQVWHSALMKWLAGSIYASIKTMGPRQAKVMSRGMALVFMKLLAKEMETKAGIKATPTAEPVNALEQFRAMEIGAGLAEDGQVALTQKPDGEIEIVASKCPYGPLCNQMLAELMSRGDFNKSSAPCMRLDTYSAALAVLNNSKRPYRLVQFAPGARCQGVLMPARGGK